MRSDLLNTYQYHTNFLLNRCVVKYYTVMHNIYGRIGDGHLCGRIGDGHREIKENDVHRIVLHVFVCAGGFGKNLCCRS